MLVNRKLTVISPKLIESLITVRCITDHARGVLVSTYKAVVNV